MKLLARLVILTLFVSALAALGSGSASAAMVPVVVKQCFVTAPKPLVVAEWVRTSQARVGSLVITRIGSLVMTASVRSESRRPS